MNVSDLLPDVLVHTPEVPDMLAERQLVLTTKEFCNKTKYWREDLAPLYLIANIDTYRLITPPDSIIYELVFISHASGGRLTVTTPHKLLTEDPTWRDRTGNPPTHFFRDGTDEVRLYPVPSANEAGTVIPRAVLTPSNDATTLPDVVLNDYYDAIVSGAVARLQRMPGKEWTQPKYSAAHEAAFQTAVMNASARATDGRQTGVARKVRYGGI